MDLLEFPSTEAEFRTRFVDERPCREYLARLKWPEGFRCAHCGGDAAYFLPSKRVVYECAGCGRQVSVIAGTIFEQSKKPLVLWFRAIFEVTASKQGISAAELQRKLPKEDYREQVPRLREELLTAQMELRKAHPTEDIIGASAWRYLMNIKERYRFARGHGNPAPNVDADTIAVFLAKLGFPGCGKEVRAALD